MPKHDETELGKFLRESRLSAGLKLRDVEEEIDVSNAYLSQIESSRIRKPSPKVLFELTKLYGVSYATAMELAGHPVPPATNPTEPHYRFLARFGEISEDEQDALTVYLEVLRSRRRNKR
jgi:transcriptional regulator with XRE-family HTH domain